MADNDIYTQAITRFLEQQQAQAKQNQDTQRQMILKADPAMIDAMAHAGVISEEEALALHKSKIAQQYAQSSMPDTVHGPSGVVQPNSPLAYVGSAMKQQYGMSQEAQAQKAIADALRNKQAASTLEFQNYQRAMQAQQAQEQAKQAAQQAQGNESVGNAPQMVGADGQPIPNSPIGKMRPSVSQGLYGSNPWGQ